MYIFRLFLLKTDRLGLEVSAIKTSSEIFKLEKHLIKTPLGCKGQVSNTAPTKAFHECASITTVSPTK